jgi:hypothetical protein
MKAMETAVGKDAAAGENFDELFRAALKVIR